MPTPKQIRYDPTNDLYKVLGVPTSATIDDIHRAYRNRAKQVHPDLNPERAEWANGQFQSLNTAHDILGNVTKRGEYDLKRRVYLDSKSAPMRSSELAQASRAAWSRRNRRRPQWYWLFQASLALVCIGSVFLMIHPAPSSDAAPPVVGAVPVVDISSTAVSVVLIPPADLCSDPNVTITEPANGTSVTAPFNIIGTATGRNFSSYTVEIINSYLLGFLPSSALDWTPLATSTGPVKNDLLVPTSEAKLFEGLSGDYTLRLTAHYTGRSVISASCEIEFQVVSPRITGTEDSTLQDSTPQSTQQADIKTIG